MKCEDVTDILLDFLHEEGILEEREGVLEHLASCEACRKELATLKQVAGLLDKWETPEVPHGLANRVLTQVATLRDPMIDQIAFQTGLPNGVLRAGFSFGGGIAASILTVFLAVLLVSRGMAGDALPLNLQVVCGIYWAITFGALFWGMLFKPDFALGEGLLREKLPDLVPICRSVLIALGVGGLFIFANAYLGVQPVQRLVRAVPFFPEPILLASSFFLIGAVFALALQFVGVFSAVRSLRGKSLTFVLTAGCLFTLAAAPVLSIVCVPFTLGFFASALVGCLTGAITGSALAVRLRSSAHAIRQA